MEDVPLIPPVGVMPDKFQQGAKEPSDIVPPLVIRNFEDAFSTRWDCDAHFVTYYPTNNGSQVDWPRCTKPVLMKLRQMGVDLCTSMLVLDYDNPGHSRWTPEMLAIFLNHLQSIADTWPMAWQWSLLYTTRNGARLVYVLDRGVPVDVAERKHQWLCQQFIARGLSVDDGVSDWTRCFRLPYVMRDKIATWTEVNPPLTIIKQPEAVLRVDTLGESEPTRSQAYGEIVTYDLPKPEHEEAMELLYHENESGQRSPTTWLTSVKRRLEGKECFDCLFKHAPLATEGRRNQTLARYIGQVMAAVARMPGTTAVHIYGLFLDPVEQLDPDAQTSNWTDVAWGMILRLWAREEAKIAGTIDLSPQEREKKALGMMDSIIEGMKKWCREPILHSLNETSNDTDKQKVYDWVSRRLIVSVGTSYALMDINGYYEAIQLGRGQLIPRWRIKGMDVVYSTRIPRENGKGYKDIGIEQLLNACATVVSEIRAIPCLEGAFIEDMDTSNAALIVPCYSRNEVLEATAKYDADVDQWLRHLFGDHYDQGVQWIQWALAFDEGKICGLSLAGAAGVGKQLLVQGLAECLTVPKTANAQDLTSNNQYGLLESPFLVINEGWPKDHNGLHPADQFRHLVGGDPISVNRKYMAPVHLRNPVRVIFTANNNDVVHVLTGGRDLSPDDREALAIRLLHIPLTSQASHWLRLKGGMSFTGSPGRRWIAGDAGQRSDYIVARHFLWLYNNRGNPPGARDRFLVEGGKSIDVMFEMRTHSGAAPIVIETLLRMIERPQLPDEVAIEGKDVYVLSSGILSFFRANMSQQTKERLTSRQVTNVLRGLIVGDDKDQGCILHSKKQYGRKRWHKLDIKLLIAVAQRDGWPCSRLDKLYTESLDSKRVEVVIQQAEQQPQPPSLIPRADFRLNR